ncbi:uncharacterized protein DUF4349 [Leucobacter luti]|uniref:Uncharacterized protein DUF4349 n=2 Tax=Leucobacter luti TaxID=340320 RepID=A0A4V3CXT4_9MICO|nr:uncharacterized protein DUF4349 [Leucobacter luti]
MRSRSVTIHSPTAKVEDLLGDSAALAHYGVSMNRRRTLALAATGVLLLAPLSACAAQQSSSGSLPEAGGVVSEVPGVTPLTDQAVDGAAEAHTGAPIDRSIVRSGELSVTVDDIAAASDRVATIAIDLNGSVESQFSQEASSQSPANASLTVRVPSDQLEEAFTRLSEVGDVVSQSRSAADVTTEHVDLQARVAALETSITRLQTLMESATSTSDLLEAESALSARQQELDGLQAQLTALEGQVDEATIWVSLTTPSVLPGGGPTSFWDGLVAGVTSMGVALSGGIVLLGILLPWLVLGALIAAAVIWIVRSTKRRRVRRATAAASASASAAVAEVRGPDQDPAQGAPELHSPGQAGQDLDPPVHSPGQSERSPALPAEPSDQSAQVSDQSAEPSDQSAQIRTQPGWPRDANPQS